MLLRSRGNKKVKSPCLFLPDKFLYPDLYVYPFVGNRQKRGEKFRVRIPEDQVFPFLAIEGGSFLPFSFSQSFSFPQSFPDLLFQESCQIRVFGFRQSLGKPPYLLFQPCLCLWDVFLFFLLFFFLFCLSPDL